MRRTALLQSASSSATARDRKGVRVGAAGVQADRQCVYVCFHIIPYVNCFGRCSACV